MMDRVTNGLPFIFVYLDDIIVCSPDLASHLQHLQLLFQRLRDFGHIIHGEKCEFGARELDFMGHRVSADGVALLRKKVDDLLEHPRPQTVQDLQAFLGAVNFYRCFLPAAASPLQPLTDALRGEARARDSLPWSTEMEAAFCSIKTALANAALHGDLPQGGRLCEPPGGGLTAAALFHFKLATAGIFFKEAQPNTAALLGF
jgi:hypothetical protein